MSKNNLKRKKNMKAAVIIFFSVLVIFLILNFVDFDQIFKSSGKSGRGFVFLEPDYSVDILKDEEYLAKNRNIRYTDGAVSILIDDGDYLRYSGVLDMLSRYIDSIINGDAAAYAAFYSIDFRKKTELPREFTMQRLYEINIEKLSEEGGEDTDGEYKIHLYRMSYMIMKNDGTFRRDMGSDALKPQDLTIFEQEGEFEIRAVHTYSYR